MSGEKHKHNCKRREWNGPTQVTEGRDGSGKFVVRRWHVHYWEEKCECGHICSSGNTTVND